MIVLADWYSKDILKITKFVSPDGPQKPVMAGANVHSLNALLKSYFISFGDTKVYSGDFVLDKRSIYIDSGTEITSFPAGGYLLSTNLQEEPQSLMARNGQPTDDVIPTLGVFP